MPSPLPFRTACSGKAFFFNSISNIPRVPYNKPPITYAQQIALLKQRGLIIADEPKATHLLEHLSYYRMSGYWYPLLSIPKNNHQFKAGATFEKAFKMYCFDRKLRSIILAELEKIEISIRAKMTYILSHGLGSFWFSDPTRFRNNDKFTKTLGKLNGEVVRSDEDFIKDFNSKYSDPMPPSWISFEVSSFGTLSMIYSNLKPSPYKKQIANFYGLSKDQFGSWIHTLVYIRNVCAHHSRLWNKVLQIQPQTPRLINPRTQRRYPFPSQNWIDTNGIDIRRLYMSLSIIAYFLQTINPNNTFKSKLLSLFAAFPSINISAMNFLPDWQAEPLWN